MYFKDDTCHFSLRYFGNTHPHESGICEIDGHKTVRKPADLKSVSLMFNDEPESVRKLNYQTGEWGPINEHTELRFYGLTVNDGKGMHASWLWEATDQHCDACDSDATYPVGFNYGDDSFVDQVKLDGAKESMTGDCKDFQEFYNECPKTPAESGKCQGDLIVACCVCGGGLDGDDLHDQITFDDTEVQAEALDTIADSNDSDVEEDTDAEDLSGL